MGSEAYRGRISARFKNFAVMTVTAAIIFSAIFSDKPTETDTKTAQTDGKNWQKPIL